MSSKVATPQDVEKAMAHWTPEQLKCRASNNHHWDAYVVKRWRRQIWWEVWEQCQSCGNFRKCDFHSRTGEKGPWRPAGYSEGYLLKGVGRLDENGRRVVRLARYKPKSKDVGFERGKKPQGRREEK